jgi:predicted nucleic acid-binding protein
MKGGKIFVDTNIVIYAYDISAGDKYKKAQEVMHDLWNSGRGIISTQVLQEFFVNATAKIKRPLDIATARAIVKDLLNWETVIVAGEVILEAVDIHREHKYSFWDSMILAAALEGGAGTLVSEDFSDELVIKGLTVHNPFVGHSHL